MKWALALILVAVIAIRGAKTPAHTLMAAATDVILASALAWTVLWAVEASALRPAFRPAFRKLAWITPPAVLLQVILGSLYRHEIWGILPHFAGAAVAGSLALILCLLLIQNHLEVQRPAAIVMTILLTQIALGITTFILRLLDMDATIWFTISSAAHITTGAITLAATVSLGRLVIGDPAAHRQDSRPENQ
jgi:hypothetical protein